MITSVDLERRLAKLKDLHKKGLITEMTWRFLTSDIVTAWNNRFVEKIRSEVKK